MEAIYIPKEKATQANPASCGLNRMREHERRSKHALK
jgi:hypothetical protein